MVVMVGFVGRRRRVVRVCAVVSGAAPRMVPERWTQSGFVDGPLVDVRIGGSEPVTRCVGRSYRVVGTAFRLPREMSRPGSVLGEIGDGLAGASIIAETPCGTMVIARGASFMTRSRGRRAQPHLRCAAGRP